MLTCKSFWTTALSNARLHQPWTAFGLWVDALVDRHRAQNSKFPVPVASHGVRMLRRANLTSRQRIHS